MPVCIVHMYNAVWWIQFMFHIFRKQWLRSLWSTTRRSSTTTRGTLPTLSCASSSTLSFSSPSSRWPTTSSARSSDGEQDFTFWIPSSFSFQVWLGGVWVLLLLQWGGEEESWTGIKVITVISIKITAISKNTISTSITIISKKTTTISTNINTIHRTPKPFPRTQAFHIHDYMALLALNTI